MAGYEFYSEDYEDPRSLTGAAARARGLADYLEALRAVVEARQDEAWQVEQDIRSRREEALEAGDDVEAARLTYALQVALVEYDIYGAAIRTLTADREEVS